MIGANLSGVKSCQEIYLFCNDKLHEKLHTETFSKRESTYSFYCISFHSELPSFEYRFKYEGAMCLIAVNAIILFY